MGPSRLNGSSTLYDVKSGPVNVSVNFEEAAGKQIYVYYNILM